MEPVGRVKVQLPAKLSFLFEPSRYKAIYSGRGASKSWSVARALLVIGLRRPIRVMCTREFQSSMRDSVHKLLGDQVKALGLSEYYRVMQDSIRGPNGTEFFFRGLRDPDALRSAEGCDIAWIEEARTVSKASFDTLIPTIRKPGSEIWLTWNPELATDEVHRRFVLKPPANAKVVKLSWRDNPFFPQELRTEMEHLKATDYDAYLTVWEGHCRTSLEGAVYASEMRRAQKDGRITQVPIARERPVHTFWDLGRGDMTAIWFVQIVGLQYRVVGYYQNSGEHISHFLDKLEELRKERGWTYGTCWLPHDADNEYLGSRRTIRQQVQDAEYRVKITPKVSIADGINAARSVFAACWFDEEACEDGLATLRQYHYDVDPKTGARSLKPDHDWSSHGADGFRYMGVALKDDGPAVKPRQKARTRAPTGRTGWMAR